MDKKDSIKAVTKQKQHKRFVVAISFDSANGNLQLHDLLYPSDLLDGIYESWHHHKAGSSSYPLE